MTYSTVRYPLSILVFVIIGILSWKVKMSKPMRICVAILGLLIVQVVYIFPIENLFMSFDTPEEVCQYATGTDAVAVAVGEESAYVVYSDKPNLSQTFLAKRKGDRYTIGSNIALKKVCTASVDTLYVWVYHIRGTNDYYLKVWGVVDSEISITDRQNREFDLVYTDSGSRLAVVGVHAIEYRSDYGVYINGIWTDLNTEKN